MNRDRGDDELLDGLRHLAEWHVSTVARDEQLTMLQRLPLQQLPVEQLPIERRARCPHQRYRRLGLAAGSFVAVCGLGTGAAAAFGAFPSEPPPDRSIAHCYTTADLHDSHNHNDFTVATAPNEDVTIHSAANYAMQICREVWRQGLLNNTAPRLIPCVLHSGQVGVFPGTNETCAELGLPVAEL
jgi:hypothetical protein